jgi:hypothetical protein
MIRTAHRAGVRPRPPVEVSPVRPEERARAGELIVAAHRRLGPLDDGDAAALAESRVACR